MRSLRAILQVKLADGPLVGEEITETHCTVPISPLRRIRHPRSIDYITTAFELLTTMAGGSTHLTSIAPRANQLHDGLHLTLRFGAAIIPHCGSRPSGFVSEFLWEHPQMM